MLGIFPFPYHAAHYFSWRQHPRPTYAHHVHETIHPVADLEEEVLALPFCWGTEGRPDEPRDTGNEEERTQDGGCNLNLLDDCQGYGLPLGRREWQISCLSSWTPFPPSSFCSSRSLVQSLNQGFSTCSTMDSFAVSYYIFWCRGNPCHIKWSDIIVRRGLWAGMTEEETLLIVFHRHRNSKARRKTKN